MLCCCTTILDMICVGEKEVFKSCVRTEKGLFLWWGQIISLPLKFCGHFCRIILRNVHKIAILLVVKNLITVHNIIMLSS